jgi:hypothetical protein
MKLRRKAVVLDAIQWKGDNYSDVYNWLMAFGGGLGDPGIEMHEDNHLHVRDRDKEMLAKVGEWFIQEDDGFVFVCDPDDFKQFYDPVHDDYVEPDGPPATFQWCKGCGHSLDQCDCDT